MAYLAAIVLLLISSFALGGDGSSSSAGEPDQACIAPLETLFDCLPYAQGKTAAPTPTCCTNMDKVFQTQKKCLCELIAASFQGGIAGLPPFNQTVALHMPSTCNIPADPSKCPDLLGIPASSPEAKEFTDAALKSNGTSVASSNSSSTSGTLSTKSDAASLYALRASSPSTFAMKSLLVLLCYL